MRAPAATLLVGCALVFSGCVDIESESASQPESIGDVEVVTTVCLSGDNSGTCPRNRTNSGQPSGGNDYQLFVSYRIPAGVNAPPSITLAYRAPLSGTLELAASPSLSAEMDAKAPTGAGKRWAGYVSRRILKTEQAPEARADIRARFGLPRGADGSPFPGPLPVRTAVGGRGANDASLDPNRPVVCAEQVTNNNPDDNNTFCVDSPKGASDEEALAGDREHTTRDAGVLPAPAVTVEQGRTGSAAFALRGAGLDGSIPFDVSASSDAPGVVVNPAATPVAPASGDTPLPVALEVPRSTPPGTYTVAATARTGAQERRNTTTLTVTPDVTPPVTFLTVPRQSRLARALKKGVKLKSACDEPCRAVLSLTHRGKKYGSARVSRTVPGRFTVVGKLNRAARKRFARSRSVKLRAALTVVDPSGNRRRLAATVKLKR